MFVIFENGKEINRIVGGVAFVQQYCEKNGYTYTEELEATSALEPIPTDSERIAALEEAMLSMMMGGISDV